MDKVATSIEQGYFVLTMMPSLRCRLNCPHCYLSKEQRQSDELLDLDDLARILGSVKSYYASRGLKKKSVIFYWYGGEPTEVGQDYFLKATQLSRQILSAADGYAIKHIVLSSLIKIDPEWYGIFKSHCEGEVQTSFDGLMRGKGYVKTWEKSVLQAIEIGLRVSTISVVNHEMISVGPESTLNYLSELGVAETSWLPFMWNEQNDGKSFVQFARSMTAYSKFMTRLTEHWLKRKTLGLHVPEIGQARFIFEQAKREGMANIAGQTLFLMPNGDFSLPDYKNGHQEFLRPFGNALTDSFESILISPARRAYLRKQVQRNGNPDCLDCPHADKCLMEFWKENRKNEDCFGARRYVEYLLENKNRLGMGGQAILY